MFDELNNLEPLPELQDHETEEFQSKVQLERYCHTRIPLVSILNFCLSLYSQIHLETSDDERKTIVMPARPKLYSFCL